MIGNMFKSVLTVVWSWPINVDNSHQSSAPVNVERWTLKYWILNVNVDVERCEALRLNVRYLAMVTDADAFTITWPNISHDRIFNVKKIKSSTPSKTWSRRRMLSSSIMLLDQISTFGRANFYFDDLKTWTADEYVHVIVKAPGMLQQFFGSIVSIL